jgi:hypothetical protein
MLPDELVRRPWKFMVVGTEDTAEAELSVELSTTKASRTVTSTAVWKTNLPNVLGRP